MSMNFPLSRRHVLGGMAAATALAGLPARSRAATDLVVGTFGGTYESLLREHIIPKFESANDASVKLELGIGNTFMPKIIAARSNPPYDVIYLNEDEAIFGRTARLWADVDTTKIPNLGDVYDALKPPSVPLYGTMVYEFTCAYNPEKMDKPTSWEDLWQKGITVGVPHISTTYGVIFLMIAAELNGGGPENMAPGFAKLKQLADMKIYKGVTNGFQMWQRGEIDAALFYAHRIQLLKADGVSVALSTPKEGTYGMRTGMQIPKNAAHPDLATAWVNMALSPEYQLVFAPKLYSPSNKAVELPPELAEKHVYGPEAISALRFAPWEMLNPQKPELLEQWNKEFAG